MSQDSGQSVAGRVSVVIAVRAAGAAVARLLEAVFAQAPVAPGEVVLVDCGATADLTAIAGGAARVRVASAGAATPGCAWNAGVRAASGEIVVLLAQEALPADTQWLAPLLEALASPAVAAASPAMPHPTTMTSYRSRPGTLIA